jgi:prepilin-type N-terminal cleavage/methylation domain-containing protein
MRYRVASIGKKRQRHAFTVVELLVVIAIIGVLVSLLLPAVGAVRDSARRTQNANNLHQIGTALQTYEEARKTLPPMVKRSVADPDDLSKAVSWAFEILPYLEQQNIYDRFDNKLSCSNPANQAAMATPIETYANPRRRDAVVAGRFVDSNATRGAVLDYAANGGVVVDKEAQVVPLPGDPSGLDLDLPFGRRFDQRFSGPFHRDLAVAAALVKDGLSNTLAVGDRWIGPPVPSKSGLLHDLAGLAGQSYHTLVRFANPDNVTNQGFPSSKTDPSVFKFGSPRGSDACFVFLDGHIRWLPYDLDARVFNALASINDGTVVPATALP